MKTDYYILAGETTEHSDLGRMSHTSITPGFGASDDGIKYRIYPTEAAAQAVLDALPYPTSRSVVPLALEI